MLMGEILVWKASTFTLGSKVKEIKTIGCGADYLTFKILEVKKISKSQLVVQNQTEI